jgi:hypothetical protein
METDHGLIPAGAFVAMRTTDWSKRWPDAARMANKDANGIVHYPGWGLPGAGSRRNCRSKLSKTKRWLRVSSAGVRDFALNLIATAARRE